MSDIAKRAIAALEKNRREHRFYTETTIDWALEALNRLQAENEELQRALTLGGHVTRKLAEEMVARAWVPVSKRLPELDDMRCAVIAPGASHGDLWPTRWDAKNRTFSAAFGWFELDEVTHWTALPTPPDRAARKTRPHVPVVPSPPPTLETARRIMDEHADVLRALKDR